MELQELMISRDQSAGAMKGKELDLYFLHLSWDTLIGRPSEFMGTQRSMIMGTSILRITME